MYKNFQLPYKLFGQYKLVDCFLAYFKASFIIDFSKAHSCLNAKYFRGSSEDYMHVNKLNCRFISKKNVKLPLEECSAYENEHKMIHGVLGRDFFEGFEFLSDDPENLMLFFFKGHVFNRGHLRSN